MFGKDKKEEYHEKVLYEAQPNIFVYSKGILISMFVLGFLFFLYSAGISYIGNMNVYLIETTKVPMTRYFAIAIFILIMAVFAYIIIKILIWTSIKYTITESRVITEKGILMQRNNYMPFNTIQDVSRSQNLLGKIFSVGTITLYSAYDGKELELKDVSNPKKIEDIIFENMRGTHLRYRNIYDDNTGFNPIRPNEESHYRRMEDLDDLELVDAKERKRQLRDSRRKARNSRNKYNQSKPNYDSYYDDEYYPEDDYYINGPADNRSNYRNSQYDNRRNYPDSHHHQYSGAIKESYERNPDKYFANNYEEFHQNNLDAQRDYYEGRDAPSYRDNNQNREETKKSGLSRFNPFSNSRNDEPYENISDEEFDTTINQAMHEMDSNIKFEPSNNQVNHNRDHNNYNSSNRGHNQSHNQNFNAGYRSSRQYDKREYDDDYGRSYDNSYQDNGYRSNSNRSRPVRDDYDYYDSRDDHGSYDSRDDYRQHDSRDDYRRYDSRDDYRQHDSHDDYRRYDSRERSPKYHDNRYDDYSESYSRKSDRRDSNYGSRQADYGYDDYNRSRNQNQSRNHKPSKNYERSNQRQHYENKGAYDEAPSNGKDNKEKTPEDLLQKHSRKFRR